MSRLAKILIGATFLLLIAGGLVTSTDSGLSVPDWPTTYGQNMFTFPPSHWVGGIRYEHSHRLIAATVGLLTVALALWILVADRRRWMKVLGGVAVFTVCLQGVLGGLTVKYLLPTPISVAHACLAQTFFCLTLAIAIFTSRAWNSGVSGLGCSASPRGRGRTAAGGTGEGSQRTRLPHPDPLPPGEGVRGREERSAVGAAVICFAVLYVQLILGAWMRHSGAGLAIPDFPASFGGIVPDHWTSKIAIHFAHRVWALVVVVTVFTTVSIVLRRSASTGARRAARLLAILLPAQVVLGAISIWTRKAVPATVAHQTLGAVLLACAAGLAIFVFREAFQKDQTSIFLPSKVAAGAAR